MCWVDLCMLFAGHQVLEHSLVACGARSERGGDNEDGAMRVQLLAHDESIENHVDNGLSI